MADAVRLRTDYSAAELRRLASSIRHANQSRRLLSLAAVVDGMNRTEAARIGGMDRQTLRDWVHRFNAHGPEGLKDNWANGSVPRLSPEQQAEPPNSSRAAPTGPCMASCAGDGSIFSAWSRSVSRSSTTSAPSASCSRGSASPTSAPGRAIPDRTRAPSRRSKKLPRDPERASRRHRRHEAGRDLVPG
jgi:winged helix-turn helix protein